MTCTLPTTCTFIHTAFMAQGYLNDLGGNSFDIFRIYRPFHKTDINNWSSLWFLFIRVTKEKKKFNSEIKVATQLAVERSRHLRSGKFYQTIESFGRRSNNTVKFWISEFAVAALFCDRSYSRRASDSMVSFSSFLPRFDLAKIDRYVYSEPIYRSVERGHARRSLIYSRFPSQEAW